MKVTETIQRECCSSDDLKKYNGMSSGVSKFTFLFCSHCGQIWVQTKDMDSSGHMESTLKKVVINERCDWS